MDWWYRIVLGLGFVLFRTLLYVLYAPAQAAQAREAISYASKVVLSTIVRMVTHHNLQYHIVLAPFRAFVQYHAAR